LNILRISTDTDVNFLKGPTNVAPFPADIPSEDENKSSFDVNKNFNMKTVRKLFKLLSFVLKIVITKLL